MKRNVMALWLALLLLLLAATTYLVRDHYFSREAKAIAQVRSELDDPDSARFQYVAYIPESGAVCGFLNAKNKFGGYGGRVRFIAPANGKIRYSDRYIDGAGSNSREDESNRQGDFFKLLMASQCHEPLPGN